MAVKRHQTHFDVTARDGTQAALSSVERNLKSVDQAVDKMGKTFAGVLSATAAIQFGREIGRAAIQAEQASTRVTAVLRATGAAAWISKGQIDSMADSLAKSTQFDDEAFRNASAELLKFGNIQGQVFKEGLALSADLAAFMGTEVPDAAQMIGKSLQSPTEGITQMERQFGKLTEAQKKNIETLVEQGDTLGAQNAILELWKEKIGGTAELMNTGLTKATKDLTKAWGELLESLGKSPGGGGLAAQGMKLVTGELERIKKIVESGSWVDKTLAIIAGHPFAPRGLPQPRLDRPQDPAGLLSGNGRRGYMPDITSPNFDLADLPHPPVLGGKPGGSGKGDGAAEREAARRAAEEAKRRAEGAQNYRDALGMSDVEAAELATRQADALIYTWDEAGNQITMTREEFEKLNEAQEKTEKAIKQTKSAAEEWGLVFNSALEDAIINGGNLSDVLKGLERDLARMILRKSVTEPLGEAAKGFLGGLDIAGMLGFGTNLHTNWLGAPEFAVGTDRVERDTLAYVHKGEAIIPASQNVGGRGGGPVFNTTYNVASPADERLLRQLVAASERRMMAAVVEQGKR